MDPKYYRTYNESAEGEVGYFYCEVTNEMITRVINEFGAQLYWSTPDSAKDERHEFTDQPEFRDQDIMDLIDNFDLVELTKEKFEELWARSKQ
ncbi:MAG: hypothetical protein HEQ39_02865 [Rhizobacter sp.]